MMMCSSVDELERYLDPGYGEGLEVCDNVKLDLVLGREEQLHSYHSHLTTLNSLKHVLDSQHIKGQNGSPQLYFLLVKFQNITHTVLEIVIFCARFHIKLQVEVIEGYWKLSFFNHNARLGNYSEHSILERLGRVEQAF